jgi:hypothetical protein
LTIQTTLFPDETVIYCVGTDEPALAMLLLSHALTLSLLPAFQMSPGRGSMQEAQAHAASTAASLIELGLVRTVALPAQPLVLRVLDDDVDWREMNGVTRIVVHRPRRAVEVMRDARRAAVRPHFPDLGAPVDSLWARRAPAEPEFDDEPLERTPLHRRRLFRR